MPARRTKVEPIRNPTLFEMEKLEQAGELANSIKVERPYTEPELLLGTSSFTAGRLAWFLLPTWRADAQLPVLLRDAIQDC
jgi:hypothetical protein